MFNISHSTLLEAIYRHSAENGNKTAVVTHNATISYGMLWNRILYSAAYLQSLGLKRGDCIVLSALKEIEFVYLYFASHLLGITNVIVDPTSNDVRKKYIINQINPKAIFGLKVEKQSVKYADLVCPEVLPVMDYIISPDDIAEVMFTTGTTGNPKGVLLSHANIAGAAENINSFIGNTAGDVEALGLPICHSFGLGRLRCNMLKGATIVLLGSFANLKLLFDAFEKYHVTGFGMVPAVWEYIKKLSGRRIGNYQKQIRYIEIGSAGMSVADKQLLCDLFPNTRICMHYGLTEASRSLFMEFHESADDLRTIGLPVSEAVDVKIMDEEGVEVPIGKDGELCVAGNMVMQSYFLSEDSCDAFWGKYFRTGDYAYQGENGKFYLVSRKKELINVGGKKVSPVEIEDAIITLGVSDCVCVAIKDPHGMLGEVPKVYLLKGGTDLTIEEISNRLTSRLEHYKLPVEYEWIDKIPVTSSGKKQRLIIKSK